MYPYHRMDMFHWDDVSRKLNTDAACNKEEAYIFHSTFNKYGNLAYIQAVSACFARYYKKKWVSYAGQAGA